MHIEAPKKMIVPLLRVKGGGDGVTNFFVWEKVLFFFIVSLQANISNTSFDQKSSGHPKVGVSKITQEMGG